MVEGVIPGNLKISLTNTKLSGIVDGRVEVVDRNTEWNGGIVVENSFEFDGANALVILRRTGTDFTVQYFRLMFRNCFRMCL